MALSDPEGTPALAAEELDRRIEKRIEGELEYLDGAYILGMQVRVGVGVGVVRMGVVGKMVRGVHPGDAGEGGGGGWGQ